MAADKGQVLVTTFASAGYSDNKRGNYRGTESEGDDAAVSASCSEEQAG